MHSGVAAPCAGRTIRLVNCLLILVSAGWFSGLVAAYWPYTVDDAYITFRYSSNLATGAGPTFNAGEPPVEGYSSPLWMALLSIFALFGIDLTTAAKCVGVLCMVLTWFIAARMACHLRPGASAGFLSTGARMTAILITSFDASAIHAVAGMETALAALLLVLTAWFLIRFQQGHSAGCAWGAALSALAVGLTRPEANAVVVAAIGACLVSGDRTGRRRLLRAALLGYVLPGALFMAARTFYYGELLPLPFHLKVGQASALAGAGEVWRFLVRLGPSLGICVLLGMLQPARALLPVVSMCAAQLAFFVWPAHIMGFDHRYLFPVFPLLVVLAVYGLETLRDRCAAMRAFPIRVCQVASWLLVAACAISWSRGMSDRLADRLRYARGLAQAHVALGHRLRASADGGRRPLLAIADAGAVPFYSGWQTLDTFGLNDRHIALSGRHDVEYVLEQSPDVIVLISFRSDSFDPHLAWEGELYRAALASGYTVSGKLEFLADAYYLWILRADSESTAVEGKVNHKRETLRS